MTRTRSILNPISLQMKLNLFLIVDTELDPEQKVIVLPPQINIQNGDSVEVREGTVLNYSGTNRIEIFKRAAKDLATVLIAADEKGEIDDAKFPENVKELYASLK